MDSELQTIAERIRAAHAHATPLRIRGGGTKDFYGEAAQGEVLDTRALAGIRSYEPSELVVTVRAGTLLSELEALLAEQGQCLPFEPPHFGAGGTVGGMVAAGLSGPARASVGAVRDYVLGVTLVDGRGEVLSFGGQVMKNVAGYDVSRVLAGSLGVLGLIAEVSLKVLPVAPAEATLRFECGQAEALDLLNGWGGRPLPLNASCWVEDQGRGVLYLRLRGAVAAVDAACAQLGGERQPDAAADWDLCRDQRLPWFTEAAGGHELWRLSVPQTAPVLDLGGDAPPLVEWHGGQRWYRAAPAEGPRLRAAAAAVGGHATLFRAAGEAASPLPRFERPSAPLMRIHAALQQEFDPAGVFDRGRLYRRDATAP
ncbi:MULTISPECIES: glycolate oxidase subunit GlcE [unclassified Variovorax]|uniref:glycolate oxidase subunit GlcE n=1 Tax=unclassified Variovorax TaxID=663243 RepID=UPI00257764ED|nr:MULTISPECIES: glycolate oxidase subunit GlcE [unclassified Variovorax]MDM0090684.1 glycolate oxidase subunit GlcE [Variovorax sp. J22G40]MDM0149314.1 glycolate oxidase subunit GlcE [Variovorax sp. J2P1-31]